MANKCYRNTKICTLGEDTSEILRLILIREQDI